MCEELKSLNITLPLNKNLCTRTKTRCTIINQQVHTLISRDSALLSVKTHDNKPQQQLISHYRALGYVYN